MIIKKSFLPSTADRCHCAKIMANVLESGRVEFIYSHYMARTRQLRPRAAYFHRQSLPLSLSVCFLIQFVFSATAGTDNAPLVNNDVIRRYLAPDIGRRPAASRIKLYESPSGFCMRALRNESVAKALFFCLCIGRRSSCKKRHTPPLAGGDKSCRLFALIG